MAFVERVIIIFMIYGVFFGICFFVAKTYIATALVTSIKDNSCYLFSSKYCL